MPRKNYEKIFNVRNFILLLLLFGFTLLVIDVTRIYFKCPPSKIIYRFVPRTFKEEQDNPVLVSDLFKTMFENPSPWVGSFTLFDEPKKFDSGMDYLLRDFEDGLPFKQDQNIDRHIKGGDLVSSSLSHGAEGVK